MAMSENMWYVADSILWFKFKDGIQEKYNIWENFYLVEAKSEKEACEKAIKRALEDEGDSDGDLLCDDRPVTMVLAGIRNVFTCSNPEERPIDGTELATLRMRVDTKEELERLATGEPVTVLYEEWD